MSIILNTKQEQAVKSCVEGFLNGDHYRCIAGYAGTGKAQPNDTPIPTGEGWKTLGEIKVGDYVFDREGRPTKVMGVFPQGKQDVYILKLKDGRETKCAGDHIWTVFSKKNSKYNYTTEQLISKGLTNSAGFKYAIPNNKAVQYLEKEYRIDPYVIGVFLGDGCCKEKPLTLSSENDEIPNLVLQLMPEAKEIKKNSEKNYNWLFRAKEVKHYNNLKILNLQTKNFFKGYENEICCEAYNKRIPEEYKYGSIEQRYSLLQGLMDTDGSIGSKDENRFNIRFTTTSKQLADDVREVLQSLGYGSSLIMDKREEKYTSNICYAVAVNIPNEEKYKLFRLQRKKDIALKAKELHKRKNYDKVSIIDVYKTNEQVDMTCILVDNKEHLYLTNNFIVTHNTTVVPYIIDAIGVDPNEDVAYIAYTGKAAQVLKAKGLNHVMTAHKFLYKYKTYYYSNGTPFYVREEKTMEDFYPNPMKPEEEPPFCPTIVVVDEVSMLPKEMWDILMSLDFFVIAMGDPFQLPVIDKDTDNHILDKPDVFLDEIMRQAKENEIIRISMEVRERKPLSLYNGTTVKIVPYSDLSYGMMKWANQILCSKNETRRALNKIYREHILKFENELPVIGDKLICLKNNWDCLSAFQEPLVNGQTGEVLGFQPFHDNTWGDNFYLKFRTDEGAHYDTIADGQFLREGKPFYPSNEKRKAYNKKMRGKKEKIKKLDLFDYGYAITVHKSQGSQYNKVLVIEEPMYQTDNARLLYTAVTRAIDKLVLVKTT